MAVTLRTHAGAATRGRVPKDAFLGAVLEMCESGLLSMPCALYVGEVATLMPLALDGGDPPRTDAELIYGGDELDALLEALDALYDKEDLLVWFSGLDGLDGSAGECRVGLYALRSPTTVELFDAWASTDEDDDPPPPKVTAGGHKLLSPPASLGRLHHQLVLEGPGALDAATVEASEATDLLAKMVGGPIQLGTSKI